MEEIQFKWRIQIRRINSFDVIVLCTTHLGIDQLYLLTIHYFPSRPLTYTGYNLHQTSKCSVWNPACAYRSLPAPGHVLHWYLYCRGSVSVLQNPRTNDPALKSVFIAPYMFQMEECGDSSTSEPTDLGIRLVNEEIHIQWWKWKLFTIYGWVGPQI